MDNPFRNLRHMLHFERHLRAPAQSHKLGTVTNILLCGPRWAGHPSTGARNAAVVIGEESIYFFILYCLILVQGTYSHSPCKAKPSQAYIRFRESWLIPYLVVIETVLQDQILLDQGTGRSLVERRFSSSLIICRLCTASTGTLLFAHGSGFSTAHVCLAALL